MTKIHEKNQVEKTKMGRATKILNIKDKTREKSEGLDLQVYGLPITKEKMMVREFP